MARPSLSFSPARRIFLDRFVLGSLGHASYLDGSEDSGEALAQGHIDAATFMTGATLLSRLDEFRTKARSRWSAGRGFEAPLLRACFSGRAPRG
jgi:hypothetical protein